MDYFVYLYVGDLFVDADGIKSYITVYKSKQVERAYLSCGAGQRPAGLHPYANGTIFSDVELKPLPSYLQISQASTDPDRYLFRAHFTPETEGHPVLFHFLLPHSFVPRRNLRPLEQPSPPVISRVDNHLTR